MQNGFRVVVVSAIVAAAGLITHAEPTSQAAEIQLQFGNLLFERGQYRDSFEAYQYALRAEDSPTAREARSGVIRSALTIAEFDVARREAETLVKTTPHNAGALALYADTIWASGLFEEAEAKYRDALAMAPELARGRHGLARSFLARSQLDPAMNEAQAALRLSPRDFEIHHTVGSIYERMHKYEEAAAAYSNYLNLLPNKDRSLKAISARSKIKFLRSFGRKVPFEMDPVASNKLYTVDFKLVNKKAVIRARVNGSRPQDFVIDTGSESTTISRSTARRLRVKSRGITLSAGVGEIGVRGLQLGRLDSLQFGSLKLRNVPCIIKSPALRDVPSKEVESLSPPALGFSMIIDYKTRKMTFGRHLPEEPVDFELPLRLYRLVTVRGLVGADHQANFVVDTGGEVISISQATMAAIGRAGARRIPLKVWGSSGWDRDAFLLTGVDLSFDTIQYKNSPVVVLNLNAASALLGYELGGIVGHRFLSKYRVSLDLDRSLLRLKALS